MTLPAAADVLVVGAGPAGAAAAATLARQGLEVLLVGPDTSRGGRAGGHDLLMTGHTRAMLESAGLADAVPVRLVDLVELRFGASVTRTICDSGAAVCDLREFRRGLIGAAIRAGARYLRGEVSSLTAQGDAHQAVIDYAGAQFRISARHAVVAVGGGSRTLPAQAVPRSSGLVCARRYRGVRLGASAILVLPPPGAGPPGGDVTCVWALPGDDGTVTVGTVHACDDVTHPGRLQRNALRALADADPRFALLRPAGPLTSEPLYAGFQPAQIAGASGLLAGDAAGLVNPFTGEGLSGAVHSGLLAGQLIGSNRARPAAARNRYARRLATTFVGCFETSRHAARRYQLSWRILAAGAASDHPFFVQARRALLLPEGPGALSIAGRLDLADPGIVLLGPFLAACDEVAISVVRTEWPFLARLALAGQGLGQTRLRPATLFFAALIAAGREPAATRAPLGAAIELAFLGASALFGSAGPPPAGRGVDWALAATLLAGDFLLAQASRLVAAYTPEVAWSFADWLAELAALRAGRLDPGSQVAAGDVFASLLEFPARMGALLGGAPPALGEAIRDFGHHCGHAFLHAEDVLAVSGMRTRLDTTLDVMLHERLSAIADRVPGRAVSRAALARDERLRATVLAAASAACEASERRALAALGGITDPVAARILRDFLATVTEPVRRHRDDSAPTAAAMTLVGAYGHET